jgi:predicted CXXCH cytochrome family protein
VAANACISCHAPHNAPVGSARILRGQYEQDCLVCHQTGSNVSGMNLYSIVGPEYAAPKYGHEFPGSVSQHDAAEPTLLNNNRHATCVDCHSPHGSESGALTPPPLIRVSQKDIAGIASDGITQLTPAINQYENCLRCHGPSTQKQTLTQFGYLPTRAIADGDFLNVIKQLATGTASSHPVLHIRSSNLLQPSLLAFMTKTDGSPSARTMGNQILCTDCHNSDDNREFGGSGPNGPHGSIFPHILERNYVFSMASSPGGTITNLTPPNLSATGPYALCAKCHNLSVVQSSTSWSGHINHMNDGFSCSTCHTAHGIIPTSGPISGLRLVNFDVRVVAQNGSLPISYSQGPNTCVLVCHNEAHNQDGTVSPANSRLRVVKK